ncbi:T9SS type A sorting domain-containing protein [Formosa sp. 4Alg 33]|uniref:T9SS type A sorting domain-containing protein n=1 Tax=Formosa sp. 4Alg 33 TaxID=3382189 RepID=UPI003D9C0667
MKKITFLLLYNIISKQILTVLLLFATTFVFAQTVTGVSPNRVTTNSIVTVTGTGFSIATPPIVSVSNNITISEVIYINSTEITFKVTNTADVVYVNGSEDTSKDITGEVMFGSTGSGVNISFIAPRLKTNSTGTHNIKRVTEVFTTWDHDNDGIGFWRSSWSDLDYYNPDVSTLPNDSHDLLGFTFQGDIYSTGVDDALLGANISGVINQTFKAYSTNGVAGNTHKDNFLIMADKLDNKEGALEEIKGDPITTDDTAIYGQTVFDVIIDGVNGLDLGTGITNFNEDVSIRFYSGNGQFGAVDDDIPDLLITQIADSGNTDIYYYADEDGNVMGRPIKLALGNRNIMFRWRVDLYDFIIDTDYNLATPQTRTFDSNERRDMKVIALELKDFEIISDVAAANYSTHGIENVNNINLSAGGKADMAFLAYNKSAFDIKSPVVTKTPVPRFICRLPSDKNILFEVEGELDGGASPASSAETLRYQWFKYNDEISGATNQDYLVNGGGTIDDTHTGAYKVRIYNDFGTAVLPVTLTEGGVPATWDSFTNSWKLPPVYSGITVVDEDRSLIFSNDYNRAVDLEGCDCLVPAGRTVTIPSGSKLKLYNNIVVQGDLEVVDEDDASNNYTIPAGIFTLENNASLVQVNDADGNINEGDIIMKRLADEVKPLDYVYWSSPVSGFNISGIPSSGKVYEWNPTVLNPNNSSGNWITASGEMQVGKGYIVQVPNNGADFTTTFTGVPNNGTLTIAVEKSNPSALPNEGNQNFNLIGNPYPSAINVDKFLDFNIGKNNNIEGAVHIWTHQGGFSYADEDDEFYQNFAYNYEDSYLVVNGMGATPSNPSFDGNIASGQAFFVKRLNSVAVDNVEFTNTMRYDSSEDGYDNDEFFRGTKDKALEKQLIWLSLVNEKRQSKSMLLGYTEGATYEKDRLYDAQANGDDFRIYSLISDEKMVIQGRPLPFSDADEVPLGIQVAANGSYQIGIDNLKGSLFENDGQDIYLEDTYLNMEHDLRHSPYLFTAVAGSSNDRFVLKYVAANTLSVGEDVSNNTYVYVNDATLYVKTTKTLKTIQVFDFSGKRVVNYSVINNANDFSSSFPFSNGGYIVKITLEDGSVINKKLIN